MESVEGQQEQRLQAIRVRIWDVMLGAGSGLKGDLLHEFEMEIREQEKAAHSRLVEAALRFDEVLQIIESGQTVIPFGKEAETYNLALAGLREALAVYEHAGSDSDIPDVGVANAPQPTQSSREASGADRAVVAAHVVDEARRRYPGLYSQRRLFMEGGEWAVENLVPVEDGYTHEDAVAFATALGEIAAHAEVPLHEMAFTPDVHLGWIARRARTAIDPSRSAEGVRGRGRAPLMGDEIPNSEVDPSAGAGQ